MQTFTTGGQPAPPPPLETAERATLEFLAAEELADGLRKLVAQLETFAERQRAAAAEAIAQSDVPDGATVVAHGHSLRLFSGALEVSPVYGVDPELIPTFGAAVDLLARLLGPGVAPEKLARVLLAQPKGPTDEPSDPPAARLRSYPDNRYCGDNIDAAVAGALDDLALQRVAFREITERVEREILASLNVPASVLNAPAPRQSGKAAYAAASGYDAAAARFDIDGNYCGDPTCRRCLIDGLVPGALAECSHCRLSGPVDWFAELGDAGRRACPACGFWARLIPLDRSRSLVSLGELPPPRREKPPLGAPPVNTSNADGWDYTATPPAIEAPPPLDESLLLPTVCMSCRHTWEATAAAEACPGCRLPGTVKSCSSCRRRQLVALGADPPPCPSCKEGPPQ